jgi:hypothetical protein
MKELVKIQTSLSAPKEKRNSFANYDYRSASDILEALKPHLKETGCFVTLTDEVVIVGDRFYVKATATITNPEGATVSATALAREAEVKKGNDDAQITGACSSYARKYALCGLFAIDDSKADPDNDDNRKRGTDEDPSKRPVRKVDAPVKKKPVIQEGNPLWQKAIDYCITNGVKASSLAGMYAISDADMVKMQETIDASR